MVRRSSENELREQSSPRTASQRHHGWSARDRARFRPRRERRFAVRAIVPTGTVPTTTRLVVANEAAQSYRRVNASGKLRTSDVDPCAYTAYASVLVVDDPLSFDASSSSFASAVLPSPRCSVR